MARIILISLLLTGCVGTPLFDVADVRSFNWSESVTQRICTAGKERPGLNRAIAKEAAQFGIAVEFLPLPEKYSREPAELFVRVTPECDASIIYRLPVGYAAVCVLAACRAGYTYAHVHRPDAVMVIDWGLPNVVAHEWYHAVGCRHEDEGVNCLGQIAYYKALLKRQRIADHDS